MGLSVTAASVILVVSFFVSFGILYAAIDDALNRTLELIEEKTATSIEKANVRIQIENITYTSIAQMLEVLVNNTGAVVLNAKEIDVLLDGKIATEKILWKNTTVNGIESALWTPKTTLKVSLVSVEEVPKRVKIVSEFGAADYSTEIYTK